MTQRRAKIEDASRLAELSGELGYAATADEMKTRLMCLLAQSSHLILVAADRDDRVLGWLHAVEQQFLETGRRCEIVGLVVGSEARGRGVGRDLVREAERWARGRGVTELSVRSNVVRKESHPFYEAVGFERVKTQHTYRRALA